MSEQQITGNEPAFPETRKLMNKGFPDTIVTEVSGGITQRAYFAALAMQGLVSRDIRPGSEKSESLNSHLNHADARRMGGNEGLIARLAVAQADALIAELNKGRAQK